MSTLNLILAAAPNRSALEHGMPLAHMAYKIGPGLVLRRRSIGIDQRGGFMCVGDQGFGVPDAEPDYDPDDALDALCRDILHECRQREYAGLICDFEGDISAELGMLQHRLADMRPKGLSLFVKERYRAAAPPAHVLLKTGVTGGSYKLMIQEHIEKSGRPPAMEIVRLFHDFRLPASDGTGAELGVDGLAAIMEKHNPTPYFSNELCANYFTYKDRDGGMHFTLFDDARSISAKLTIAESMDCLYAFALLSEIEDLLPLKW